MKRNAFTILRIAVFAFAVAGARSTRAAAEDVIKQTFATAAGGQLVLNVDRGSIEVAASSSANCEIVVTRKARNQKSLDEYDITIAQDGARILVIATNKPVDSWFGQSLQVEYRIKVPSKFDVDLKTSGGSVEVTGLIGKVKAHTSGGSLRFEKIEGPLEAKTAGGRVTATDIKGTVEMNTSGGGVKLENIEGDVSARTSGGSIAASRIIGKSVLRTSGGSVTVAGVKGQVAATTSGGTIEARIDGQPSGECSFKTAGGSVSVELVGDVMVDVDAQTSAGRVSSDFATDPPQDPKNKSVLRGRINGGGPLIVARTSGGSIRLKRDSVAR